MKTFEFTRYRLFVFDLDNTLIREDDYLMVGYSKVAQLLASVAGKTFEDLWERLKRLYSENGRTKLFDTVCEEQGLSAKELLPQCLEVLRTVKLKTPLDLYNWVRPILLECVKNDIPTAVLTNGNPIQQMNKFSQIEWAEFPVPFLCLADNLKAKPDPSGLIWLMKTFKAKPLETVFIGDEDTDREAAKLAGVSFFNASSVEREVDEGKRSLHG